MSVCVLLVETHTLTHAYPLPIFGSGAMINAFTHNVTYVYTCICLLTTNSKTFKWNGNRRHKYIQSKKEKETLTLEINRRSIIHSDNSAVPVFGAQVRVSVV